MKILIISGFLGAGKTTFIKALRRGTGREFVLVENEFGEANIDSQRIEEEQKKVNQEEVKMDIWELTEGCICCSLNLDFTYSVLTIANTLNPDFLIVEPSGVAHLSSILKQLSKVVYKRIELLAPITIVDAGNYWQHRTDFENYFNDQVASAGTLVLSKSEELSPGEFRKIAENLEFAPDINFPLKHYTTWSREEWLSLLTRALDVSAMNKVGERFRKEERKVDEQLLSLAFYDVCFPSIDFLYSVLEKIVKGYYGQIVRFKGYIRVGEEVVFAEGVNYTFEIIGLDNSSENYYRTSEESDQEKLAFVVIGKKMKGKVLSEVFANTFDNTANGLLKEI